MLRMKQPLNKSSFRHTGEGDPQDVGNVARGHGVRSDQYPVNKVISLIDWMLVSTRMTTLLIVWLLVITPVVSAATGRILDEVEAEQADKTSLVAEADIFKSIGMSIALSLAQCEGQDQCSVIHANEVDQLIGKLNERINELIVRQHSGDGDYSDILSLYVDQRENYLRYQDRLEDIVGMPEIPEPPASTETQVFGTDDQQGGVDLSVFEDAEQDLGGDLDFIDDFNLEDDIDE